MRFLNELMIICLSLGFSSAVTAAGIPARLPDPDGKPGNATKPVQVYILAGQSNMVGMGNLSGARNHYSGIYYSSDPNVPIGPLSIYEVGNFRISQLDVFSADGKPSRKPILEGQFEVPERGMFEFQCGTGPGAVATMSVDGRVVYQQPANGKLTRSAISLEPRRRYAFRIAETTGKPPRFWIRKTDLLGNGDLDSVVRREGRFPWLIDEKGNWTVRNDVYFQEARIAENGKGSSLSATSNGKSIGPELGFGYVMGTFHDEQVLLIKTAMGNRALGYDFRPPSSGRKDPGSQWESLEYRLMVDGVRKTLKNIAQVVPGYQGQGYQIAGFAWFQGHKDSFSEPLISEYEQNLVNLIQDVRKEFEVPRLPVVVATVGFGGYRMSDKFLRIHAAQMAVGDPERHPELAGTVTSVDTRDFWRELEDSPQNQDYHYHRNAETYLLVGDALGRALVRLRGGQAEPLPDVAGRQRRQLSPESQPDTKEARAALAPILLDGIATSFAADPRNHASLVREAQSQAPERSSQFLRGKMFGLVNCFRAAGISEYDWHQFGPDLDEIQWEFFSFDPPESLARDRGQRFRKVTWPSAMRNWMSPEFDAVGAGWQTGRQPFGQLDGQLAPLSESCKSPFCRCGMIPRTLWKHEVLAVRTKIRIPPTRKNHRYRIVLGGAAHVNSGEGFAIWINGRLLAESATGVAVRQGGQPRGAHVTSEFLDEFRKGSVTISAVSFLRYNHPRIKPYPPRGHLSLRLEEQKLPSLVQTSSR